MTFEKFYCLLDFEFELELFLDHREINNGNRGDMASLAWNYYSLIIRASQEACSVYPCQMFAIKLLIIFAIIVNQMYGIHVFVMLTLVACCD